MATIKVNWLRAVTGLSLVLGIIFGVNAFEKKSEGGHIESATKTEKVVTQQQWYNTDATGQIMVSLLTTPPPTGPSEGCAQDNEGDAFCAKLLEFDASVNPADLEGNTLSYIENNITDVEERGQAKHPEDS